MPSIGLAANEIRIHEPHEHRTIYVAKFPEAIYVLHCFEKKHKRHRKKILISPGVHMPKCKNNEKSNEDFELEMSSGNVFKDIGFDDEEAANLLMRTQLLSKLRDLIEETGLSQRATAKQLLIQQPRVAEIMAMKIQYFSVDTLLKYLDRLGQNVELKFLKKKKRIA